MSTTTATSVSLASTPVPSPARTIAMEPYESMEQQASQQAAATPNGTSIVNGKRSAALIQGSVGNTAGDVKLFRHQVGGRCPLLSSATYLGTIMKPAVKREQDFYDNMERDIPSLIPFVPTYHGTLQMAATLFPAAMSEEPAANAEGCAEWGRHEGSVERMNIMIAKSPLVNVLVLEDLSHGYYRPSILDLKIGTRQHGPGAPPIKIASKTMKCTSTTSATLGLRMCGMQVFRPKLDRYVVKDKFFGRKLDTTTFPLMVREYFEDGSGRVRTELLTGLLARLRAFREVMCQQTQFRFYSCSLFLIHEGAFTAGNNVPLAQLPLPSPRSDSKSPSPPATTAATPADVVRLPTNEETKASGVPSMASPSVDPRLRCDLRLLDFAQTGRPSEEGGDDNADLDHGLLLGVDSLIRILSSFLAESPVATSATASLTTTAAIAADIPLPTPVASLPSPVPPVAAVGIAPVAVPGSAFPPQPTHSRRISSSPASSTLSSTTTSAPATTTSSSSSSLSSNTANPSSSSHLPLSVSAPALPRAASSTLSSSGLTVNTTHSASSSAIASLIHTSTPSSSSSSSSSSRQVMQTESPSGGVGTGHGRRDSATSSPLPQSTTAVRRAGSNSGGAPALPRVASSNTMANNGSSGPSLMRIGSSGASSSATSLIHNNEMPAVSVS